MRVLTFAEHYLPGFKAGGPIRTIQGMVDYLSPEIEFSIVALNHDLGENEPYANVPTMEWTTLGQARVCYVPSTQGLEETEILHGESWDLMYLNSFFSPTFSIRPLEWQRKQKIPVQRVLLAPRGEFAPSALAIKPWRKKLYRAYARSLGHYRTVFWQASSEAEKALMLEHGRGIVQPEQVFIAADVPPKSVPIEQDLFGSNDEGPLRVVFLSRISKMKNLEHALQVLQGIEVPVTFDIYGPIDTEEADYWAACQQEIDKLPGNVTAKYHGPVGPTDVAQVMASHDLLLLPTRGENFGHVIFEALQAGCPVLISDRTPWHELPKLGLSWTIPLEDMAAYRQVINTLAAESTEERQVRRDACRKYGSEFVQQWDVLSQNRKMFAALQGL